jgi:hypothetical protein
MRRDHICAILFYLGVVVLLAMLSQSIGIRHHTWTLIQHPNNSACTASATSCTITMTQATGSGNLLIGVVLPGGTSKTFSTGTAGAGTWVHPTGCAASDTTAGSADIGYVLSSTSGVSSIVLTISAAASAATWSAEVVEYHFTSPPSAFDVCSERDASTAAANLAGVSVGTISGTNDVVVQYGLFAGTASGCPNSAASPADFPSGDAVCGLMNTTSNTAGTYTNTSGRAALGAAAFKETSTVRIMPPSVY